jgi:hypothetical protein
MPEWSHPATKQFASLVVAMAIATVKLSKFDDCANFVQWVYWGIDSIF